MDASKITQLRQIQNNRYVNRNKTLDSSTLIWKTQIQSSKYIKGVATCSGDQNVNVPTQTACSGQNGTCNFGGSFTTIAIATGSSQHFLTSYAGASGSAGEVYSSERILLQKAGKNSCGIAGTNPAPQNSYVVYPGGDPTTSNSQLQVPSYSYYCTNTNGPTESNPTIGLPGSNTINNNSNPYLPPYDTYYLMKNPGASPPSYVGTQATPPSIPDQNLKHFVQECHTRFPNANNGVSELNTDPATCNNCIL